MLQQGGDNDFHLSWSRPENYAEMYMRWSCLACPGQQRLVRETNAARDAFKAFFGTNYRARLMTLRPAIPVDVEGSLFFDMTHARVSIQDQRA